MKVGLFHKKGVNDGFRFALSYRKLKKQRAMCVSMFDDVCLREKKREARKEGREGAVLLDFLLLQIQQVLYSRRLKGGTPILI